MTAVGWIGTGVMDATMCRNLLDAGHTVTVTSRTETKATALLGAGARWATSPRAVAAASEVVFTMVGYPSDVRDVVLGEDGVLEGAAPGALLVDMTPSDPTLAVEIAEVAASNDIRPSMLPCPAATFPQPEVRLRDDRGRQLPGDARGCPQGRTPRGTPSSQRCNSFPRWMPGSTCGRS